MSNSPLVKSDIGFSFADCNTQLIACSNVPVSALVYVSSVAVHPVVYPPATNAFHVSSIIVCLAASIAAAAAASMNGQKRLTLLFHFINGLKF